MSGPPLLVGHSMGGLVISAAAEKDPDAFKSLVYLAAFLPSNGQALMDLTAEHGGGPGRLDGDAVVLEREEARMLFYHDCPHEQAEWALSHIRPQPVSPALEPVTLSQDRWGRLRRDYIVCSEDRAIKPDYQRLMAARACCHTISELNCGHSPFLFCPSELSRVLIGFLDEA
jgi:pimeloyl-ACP methyl ester carboxylesterase